ncbi:MAG: bifunctional metallophosphatase/5'-nucleotidase [Solobacterium sp.]|nr:bifunctional metallophosphatase/5'-nucleotidase [Solobacterium sp.]
MKKLTALFTLLCLLLTTACARPESKAERTDDIYIFFTSDVHCGVDENLGFASMKALVDDTKAEHEYVTLVDLGDYIQGGTLGSISLGGSIIDLMNQAGYDIATIGNHEFDYTSERLGELLKKTEFQVVLCNVSYTGNNESIFKDTPAYVIKNYASTKVAFIGILTPGVTTSSTPAYFMEDGKYVYDFYNSDDGKRLAEQVQKTVDEARKAGAEYVIALSHLGSMNEMAPNDAITLIHNTRGIDAVLDGHSHSVIIGDRYPNADGEDVLLSSVGTKMENVGELIIGKDGTLDSLLIAEYNREDAAMKEAIEKADAEIEAILNEKYGELPFDLEIADENGIRQIRCRETNAGDFCTDAVRYLLNTDIAVLNGGGIRHALNAGDVTLRNLLDIYPWEEELSSCKATGQQILDLLEYTSKDTQAIAALDGQAAGEFGGFLQVSGLRYTIDTSIESGVITDENGMLAGFEGERRVKDVEVLKNGEYVPIDPTAEYTVASTSYVLFEGGDGNNVLNNCERLSEDGPVDIQALIMYFAYLGTVPDSYRAPEGRITVK